MIRGDTSPVAEVRILALGDSYTIGEGVEVEARWPVRLAAMMRARGIAVAEPTIVATTGWTTDELSRGIDSANPVGPFDVVTLLVCGVVTNGCVEGTVRDASDLGYQVVMVEDACAAVTPALHQAAITNLKDAFCNCRSTDEVFAELQGDT